MEKERALTFEAAMEKLEKAAENLKNDSITLEDALKNYEEGVEYYKKCDAILRDAKSFARIHRSNLINSGIIPLTFVNPAEYNDFAIGQALQLADAVEQVGNAAISVKNLATGKTYEVKANLTPPEKEIILAGGKINQIKGE